MILYERTDEDIDRGLVGYWKLNDKKIPSSTIAIDRTNFNDGVITGATNTTGINGLNADAMFFDGVDDMVEATITDMYFDDMSISFRINPVSGIDKYLMSYQDSSDNRVVVKYTESNGGKIELRFNDTVDSFSVESPANVVPVGEWSDIVFVKGTTAVNSELYINGIKQTITTGTTGSSGATSTLNIGARDGVSYFNGSAQSLRIYNRRLTDGEASKIARLKL